MFETMQFIACCVKLTLSCLLFVAAKIATLCMQPVVFGPMLFSLQLQICVVSEVHVSRDL